MFKFGPGTTSGTVSSHRRPSSSPRRASAAPAVALPPTEADWKRRMGAGHMDDYKEGKRLKARRQKERAEEKRVASRSRFGELRRLGNALTRTFAR